MNQTLNVGDLVTWRGGWGTDLPLSARVTRINPTTYRDPKGEDTPPLSFVPWPAVIVGRSFVVSLDNGHWAYGNQIRPSA